MYMYTYIYIHICTYIHHPLSVSITQSTCIERGNEIPLARDSERGNPFRRNYPRTITLLQRESNNIVDKGLSEYMIQLNF